MTDGGEEYIRQTPIKEAFPHHRIKMFLDNKHTSP